MVKIYIMERCKSTFLHLSPSLVEIEWAQGQRWIMWHKDRRGQKWGYSSCCHDSFVLQHFLLPLQRKRTNVDVDRVKRDISTVMVRGDIAFPQPPLGGNLSNPYSICWTCHASTSLLLFLSSCPRHSLLILPLLLAEWEGWGLHTLCMAKSSGRGRRWDAALM